MKDVKKLEEIMKLMKLYQIDGVELGDIKINKTIHLAEVADKKPQNDDIDEEHDKTLFYSAGE